MNRVSNRLALGTVAALVASSALVLGIAAPASAASTCAGFIPATIATQAELTEAITQAQSANCPGGDTIDLAGGTVIVSSPAGMSYFAITTDVTITNGTIITSGATNARLFQVDPGGALTVSAATLAGGITTTSGGAVFVSLGAQLTVIDSTLIDNHATASGGAISNGGTTTVIRSAIIDGSASAGGGIHTFGTLTVSNSTISGNVAEADDGSAIQSAGLATTIVNSTIAENTGANAVYLFSGTLALLNSIIANNFGAPGCVKEVGSTVTFSAGASNVIEGDGGCGTAGVNYSTSDPAIAFGAGPIYHFRPLAGSPIINAGDAASVGGAVTDQRGQPRVVDGTVDLGSVERAPQTATVQFAAAASSALENSGLNPLYLLATDDGDPLVSSIQFSFAAAGGTASAADYLVADAGVVTVPAGALDESTLPLTALTIVGDDVLEPDETLQLVITEASGATVGPLATTVHTIRNDDAAKLAATGAPTLPIIGGAVLLLALGGAFGLAGRSRRIELG
jgi:hypothetical protein